MSLGGWKVEEAGWSLELKVDEDSVLEMMCLDVVGSYSMVTWLV